MTISTWATNGRIVRRWDDEQDAELARLIGDGFTQKEIAAQLGRSVKGINGRISALGKAPNKPGPWLPGPWLPDPWLPEQDAQLLELSRRGLSHAAIGNRLDPKRSKRSVRDRLEFLRNQPAAPLPEKALAKKEKEEDEDAATATVPMWRPRILPGTKEARAIAEKRLDLFRLWESRNARLAQSNTGEPT